jgi:hypothetical protein
VNPPYKSVSDIYVIEPIHDKELYDPPLKAPPLTEGGPLSSRRHPRVLTWVSQERRELKADLEGLKQAVRLTDVGAEPLKVVSSSRLTSLEELGVIGATRGEVDS